MSRRASTDGRARRWGRRLLRVVATLLLSLLVLVALVVATVNLPWVRARLARELSERVSEALMGSVSISRLGHIGFSSVTGIDAELLDTSGRRVLTLSDASVALDLTTLLRGLVGDAPLTVAFEHIDLSRVYVRLLEGPAGGLSLLEAFEPAPTSARPEGSASEPLRWRFAHVTLENASVQGDLGSFESLDIELQNLTATGSVDAKAARFELEHVSFRASPLPALNEIEGKLSAAGQIQLDKSEDAPLGLNARAQLSGAAGGIPFQARARYADEQLAGYVDVHSSSSSLRRLWPDAAVEDPVSLFIGFDGTLERVAVLSVLESSAGELYIRGHVSLAPRLSGRFSVLGLRLDAGGWLSELPESSLQVAAAVRFEVAEGSVRGRLALRTWSSTWAGRELPELALSARLGDEEAEGTLRFELAGASAIIEATLSPLVPEEHEAQSLHLSVVADVRDLARLARELELADELGGELRLNAEVDVELGALPLLTSGELTATLEGVTAGPVTVRSAELRVSPRGLLQDPQLSFSLNARRLLVANYPLRRLDVRGRGDLDELAITGRIQPRTTAPVRLQAMVLPKRQLAREIELVMVDGGPASAALRLSVERLALTPSGWYEVRNLELQGPVTGRLHLNASMRGRRVRVDGSATDFAPVVLAKRLRLPFDVPRGIADLQVALDYRPGHISGELRGGVTRFCMGEIRGGKLDAELAIEDNVLGGSAAVQIPDLVQARLEADSLKLPRSWAASQLSQVTGELELSASADLAHLRPFLPESWLSASSRGQIRAHVSVAGEPGDRYPKLRLDVSTEDLAWSLPAEAGQTNAGAPGVVMQPERWTWQGMDVRLVAEVADSTITASADVLDSGGSLLVTLQGSTRVPLDRLLQQPENIDPRELPIELRLEVPNRRLSTFPLPLRFEGLNGSVSAQVTATGTVGSPALAGQLTLTKLQLQGGRALPLAITAGARLRDERLELTADVHDERRHLLALGVQAEVSGGGAPPALEQLELELRSNGLPLESLGAALGLDVSGELYGSLHLQDLPARPSAQGTLWVNDPEIAGFRQNQARWVIDADADSFSTQLELRQQGGHARASASGPWQWGAQLLPELQPAQTALELEAEDFDLEALRAFMPEQARALSGQLDADLNIASGDERRVAGKVQLTEGAVYVAALGQEFRDIRLDASVAPSGAVTIERLSARALSGRVSARGEAALDGLMLRTAQLVAEIPESAPLPLMLEGVTVANAWGRFNIDARLEAGTAGRRPSSQQQLHIGIAVPRLHVILPEQAPQDVQELEKNPTIVTGTYLEGGRFLVLPIPPYQDDELGTDTSAPLLVNIEIELGDGVWVERGTQLEVKLDGSVELTLKDELSARGQLTLERGTLDVRGRIFEIERGVITFAEERAPSNPTVVATARYTAPEGTEVYAEFVGPVETGTLSLRSEPPLRDDQILSLLLFGTPDGNFGASTGEGGVSGAALAAGGSVVTQGLNQELKRFTALDIQTRIGEREGQPQPEVVVQVSPRLSAELAYSVANANPGRAQDRTYLTLDLRLFRNWSLSTTIGDAGSLLVDLFWRYRY